MLLKQVWPQEGREARPVVVELVDFDVEVDSVVDEVVERADVEVEEVDLVLEEVVLERVEELDMVVEELQLPN